jgi:hypothetical protein
MHKFVQTRPFSSAMISPSKKSTFCPLKRSTYRHAGLPSLSSLSLSPRSLLLLRSSVCWSLTTCVKIQTRQKCLCKRWKGLSTIKSKRFSKSGKIGSSKSSLWKTSLSEHSFSNHVLKGRQFWASQKRTWLSSTHLFGCSSTKMITQTHKFSTKVHAKAHT